LLCEDVEQKIEARRYFISSATLFARGMLSIGFGRSPMSESEFMRMDLGVPRRIASLILGEYDVDDQLLAFTSHKITPKVTLEDVVLDGVTRERVVAFVQAARRRSTVFGSWGFGKKATYGKGLSALFSGPSGTGKTLTAEAVAGELGQVLYPVRMDTVVSKYVGETEKNLAKIFEAARESDAVILFDEADAVFGKRLDEGGHHAHYINQQINVLLSQLERFDGLVLLATNRAESFDEAFERRIRFHIRFNMPDVRARAAIWRRLLPAEAPVDEDVDFDALAKAFEFTGGTIKSVLLRAAFDAAAYGERLSQELLFKSARAECPFAPKRAAVGF